MTVYVCGPGCTSSCEVEGGGGCQSDGDTCETWCDYYFLRDKEPGYLDRPGPFNFCVSKTPIGFIASALGRRDVEDLIGNETEVTLALAGVTSEQVAQILRSAVKT
ncbi:MAG: hypothetical protein E5Y88_12305 [Mesorhizobium sp.]|uniref:hypothetical protein n=1 Tax=Mesorhizobium sp. TaxID=1871066 RepID=UPI00120A5A69|nr:hypothetical protein [Mesorhizobium sp.]TIL25724.1 MAG: hypothetical protein E5Y88_12305 [Mesorhizobium sp.]